MLCVDDTIIIFNSQFSISIFMTRQDVQNRFTTIGRGVFNVRVEKPYVLLDSCDVFISSSVGASFQTRPNSTKKIYWNNVVTSHAKFHVSSCVKMLATELTRC